MATVLLTAKMGGIGHFNLGLEVHKPLGPMVLIELVGIYCEAIRKIGKARLRTETFNGGFCRKVRRVNADELDVLGVGAFVLENKGAVHRTFLDGVEPSAMGGNVSWSVNGLGKLGAAPRAVSDRDATAASVIADHHNVLV